MLDDCSEGDEKQVNKSVPVLHFYLKHLMLLELFVCFVLFLDKMGDDEMQGVDYVCDHRSMRQLGNPQ